MAIKTQLQLNEMLNKAFEQFLEKCAEIQHHKDCHERLKDSIEDMTGYALDGMTDIERVAEELDDEDDAAEAKLDREHEKFELAMLRR